MNSRILTSVLGIPAVIAILILSENVVIDIVFSIMAILSMNELLNAFNMKNKPMRIVAYISAISIAFIHVIPQNIIENYLKFYIPIYLVTLFFIVIISNMKIKIKDLMTTFFAIIYISGFILFLPLIRGLDGGKIYIWYGIIIAWGTDAGAYIFGKLFGKHKFSEISPNKTIEGCVGGIVFSTITTLLFTMAFNHFSNINISYMFIGIVSIIISIISQFGDFAASSIKRETKVKDFGDLLPGHGGMLDRIDSVIFVAPFIFFIFSVII